MSSQDADPDPKNENLSTDELDDVAGGGAFNTGMTGGAVLESAHESEAIGNGQPTMSRTCPVGYTI